MQSARTKEINSRIIYKCPTREFTYTQGRALNSRSQGGYVLGTECNGVSGYIEACSLWMDIWNKQAGKCLVCNAKMKPQGRGIDSACVHHNHSTGNVIGLLCFGCNILEGYLSKHAKRRKIPLKSLVERLKTYS